METQSGYASNGLPFARIGNAPGKIVMFSGSELEHKPPAGIALKTLVYSFKGLLQHYTIYLVGRRRHLPLGYTAQQMSDDFAEMIRADIGQPVHVMGISSGGSSALHFAVDHADLLDKLVLGMTAHRMNQHGIDLCHQLAVLARAGDWQAVYGAMGEAMADGAPLWLVRPMMRVLGGLVLGKPQDGSDFAIVLESDINLNVVDKLPRITAPTLIIAGDRDPFYPADIIRQTADCIPNAQLHLIPNAGHKPNPRAFEARILQFLKP